MWEFLARQPDKTAWQDVLTPSHRLSGHNALGSSWRRSASRSRAILSAYDDATALAHQKLLPAALSVGNGPAERMATAVRHERVLSTVGTVVAALLRLTLLALALFTLLVRRRPRGRRIGVPVVVAALVRLALGTRVRRKAPSRRSPHADVRRRAATRVHRGRPHGSFPVRFVSNFKWSNHRCW